MNLIETLTNESKKIYHNNIYVQKLESMGG